MYRKVIMNEALFILSQTMSVLGRSMIMRSHLGKRVWSLHVKGKEEAREQRGTWDGPRQTYIHMYLT